VREAQAVQNVSTRTSEDGSSGRSLCRADRQRCVHSDGALQRRWGQALVRASSFMPWQLPKAHGRPRDAPHAAAEAAGVGGRGPGLEEGGGEVERPEPDEAGAVQGLAPVDERQGPKQQRRRRAVAQERQRVRQWAAADSRPFRGQPLQEVEQQRARLWGIIAMFITSHSAAKQGGGRRASESGCELVCGNAAAAARGSAERSTSTKYMQRSANTN